MMLLAGWVGGMAAALVAGVMSLDQPEGSEEKRERLSAQSSFLRVLLVFPAPLITLLHRDGAWMSAAEWDASTGAVQPLPLWRSWRANVIEGALRMSGASLGVAFLLHPSWENLATALEEQKYDVVILSTHAAPGDALYLEGAYGESQALHPSDLGRLLARNGVRLLILSPCSPEVGDVLRRAGVTIIGLADVLQEDMVCAYLETLMGSLAQGNKLRTAHESACSVLTARWGARVEDTLPQLMAPWWLRQSRMVRPGGETVYMRLNEPLPPLPSLSTVRLCGRERDQVMVQCALLAPSVADGVSPLVTLYGVDGVGKSALARSVARWSWERAFFPEGVQVVSLADVRVGDGETLLDGLVRALNLPAPSNVSDMDEGALYRAKLDALCAALGSGRQLLVLDHFEALCGGNIEERIRQAGGACQEDAILRQNLALLAELRYRCPNLHLLVTSRCAPLGLTGETAYGLSPLTPEAAVELFCDRAGDVARTVNEDEMPIVAEICEMMHCIPLHIRLVASHIRFERPSVILEELRNDERQYHLRAVNLPDEPAHSRSRKLALRYTYHRLSDDGKRLWALLAGIFIGGPSRAAVREVYGTGADIALDELLIWQVVESEGGRHRMAEVARVFGRDRLAEKVLGVDEPLMRARHAAYYLAYAQRCQGDLDALERELPDILMGLRFAEETRDSEMVRGYRVALDQFLRARRAWDSRLRWLLAT